MHHFIYPAKDTYITNRNDMDDKNFGIDEILQVGTSNVTVRTLSPTKTFSYNNSIFANQTVTYFTGFFTGSFTGTVASISGSITGSGIAFSASYFSGSVDGTGSVGSGSFGNPASGSNIVGTVTGSFIAVDSVGLFTGKMTGSVGCLYGTGSGIDIQNTPNWITTDTKFVDRSLLQFDLSAISASIANGTISSPSFFLRVKVCNETDLPISYNVYALPISQSWNMGNGYFADGGSDTGVSWDFRDNNDGIPWYTSSVSGVRPAINFIANPSLATASFGYGGGTFYTSSWCSQSFSYESSDINMNVTSMVMSWLSASLPNQGLLLIHSDELQSTGSGFVLKFFSRDTNTIYSPHLDVMWDDVSATFSTGSSSTSSVVITTINSGITASVQSGSNFSIAGGISGSFSGSAVLTLVNNNVYTQFIFVNETLEFTGSFTGSFSGNVQNVVGTITGSNLLFSASYFSGSIDGVSSVFSGSVSGSSVTGSITGSIISPNTIGQYSGQLTASTVTLTGTGSHNILVNISGSGFVLGYGLSGNIFGLPVVGFTSASITVSSSLVNAPCGNMFYTQFASGSFYSGIFSGSTFTAYYVGHRFENAFLTGSWTPEALYGARVTIGIPSGIDPYAYAHVTGLYVNGNAFGTYAISGSTSASFNGQFIDGNLIGGVLSLQLSGSVYTSSFSYTSSVEISSSVFTGLDTGRPFTVTLFNVHPTYKAGDIALFNVFGRKQFPLKTFGKSTQQEQYLVPEFLPTSSYYALKDNETGEIIMNFDNYTRIGCTYPVGNYFVIDTTSLPQERYYRVLIRVDDGQSIYTIDTGKTFKVTR